MTSGVELDTWGLQHREHQIREAMMADVCLKTETRLRL